VCGATQCAPTPRTFELALGVYGAAHGQQAKRAVRCACATITISLLYLCVCCLARECHAASHSRTSQTPSNPLHEHRYFVGFFQKLQSTESCSTDATPLGFLNLALFTLTSLPCASAYGRVLNGCLLTEYSCFIEGNCRQCLTAVLAAAADGAQGTKAAALRSPACVATTYSLLTDLADNCAGATFPVCTFYKQTCASTPACASCLAKLDTGDGIGAAKQCPGMRKEGSDMDNVVSNCMSGTPAACSFWQQRCADNDNCSTCIAEIDGGDNARTIALDWSTPSCWRQMVWGRFECRSLHPKHRNGLSRNHGLQKRRQRVCSRLR
jgi:hypothetical protein